MNLLFWCFSESWSRFFYLNNQHDNSVYRTVGCGFLASQKGGHFVCSQFCKDFPIANIHKIAKTSRWTMKPSRSMKPGFTICFCFQSLLFQAAPPSLSESIKKVFFREAQRRGTKCQPCHCNSTANAMVTKSLKIQTLDFSGSDPAQPLAY